jgi:2-dehydro-3-deoxyphosphooctonate aldolase (KDO 8-P synthase)
MSKYYQQLLQNQFFIAGPCVIESEELIMRIAEKLAEMKARLGVEIVFKASFDKANRTSISSFRGPGLEAGLRILEKVKKDFQLPLTTDVHESAQVASVGEVVDIVQIPAFLCRQTDLLVEAAKTGKIVNIKKGQFLSGEDMQYPVEKVKASGNEQVFLTERGNIFGYNNLIVDFRNVSDMQQWAPVIMDCTHAVQRPGGAGGKSGGDRKFAPLMARAAKIFGARGFFMETHPNPDHALSDGPNMIPLDELEAVIRTVSSEGEF